MEPKKTFFYISVLFCLSLGVALLWKALGIAWLLIANNWQWPALNAHFALVLIIGIILSYPLSWALKAIIKSMKK